MTTAERVAAALNHEEPDRVPIWTLIDSAAVLRHFAPAGFDFSPLTEGQDSARPPLLELTARAARGLGIDVTFLCGTYALNPFPGESAEVFTRGAPDGPFKTVADLAGFTPEIPAYEDVAERFVERFRQAERLFQPDTMLVVQGGASLEWGHGTLGLEMFSTAIYDAPSDVGRILDACSERERIMAQIYADHRLAPAYQISCDIACKGRTFFSPDFLRRELIPRLKREIEPVKQAGIKVILHSDGDLTGILDDLVDAGIDGLNPIEPTAGMDLARVKKRYGKNLVLVGNADPNILTFGTRAQVEDEVRRCIRDAAPGGGYFLDTGAGEIMPIFPVENVICLCEAVRKYGRYPIDGASHAVDADRDVGPRS